MSNLSGRITIIDDDLDYDGSKVDAYSHYSVRIERGIVNETTISFIVCPHTTPDTDDVYNYAVTLNHRSGNLYEGRFTEASDPDNLGEIKGELFSNDEKYMLHGTWIEYEYAYTFWVIIHRNSTPTNTLGSIAP